MQGCLLSGMSQVGACPVLVMEFALFMLWAYASLVIKKVNKIKNDENWLPTVILFVETWNCNNISNVMGSLLSAVPMIPADLIIDDSSGM